MFAIDDCKWNIFIIKMIISRFGIRCIKIYAINPRNLLFHSSNCILEAHPILIVSI